MLLKCGFSDATRWLLSVALIGGLIGPVSAQSPPSPALAFEVVSIKPNPKKSVPIPGGSPGVRINVAFRAYLGPMPAELRGISGDRFEDLEATVGDLIADAYRMRPFQIIGLPKWAAFDGGEGYDLQAKLPSGQPSRSDDVRRMLQTALAERFSLRVHRDRRVMQVYELRIAKGGPKLRAAPPGAKAKSSEKPGGPSILEFSNLIRRIEQFLDRPLSDMTGLSGMVETSWDQGELERERRTAGALSQNSLAPSIFTAVKEQLGLELKATNAPHEVLVVDSVQRPSVN